MAKGPKPKPKSEADFPIGTFIRTCQECFNVQQDDEEKAKEQGTSYRNRKCRICKSEALDYGTTRTADEPDDVELDGD